MDVRVRRVRRLSGGEFGDVHLDREPGVLLAIQDSAGLVLSIELNREVLELVNLAGKGFFRFLRGCGDSQSGQEQGKIAASVGHEFSLLPVAHTIFFVVCVFALKFFTPPADITCMRNISVFVALLTAGCWTLQAQQPTVAPSAVTFNYQLGNTPLIQQQKVVLTLPAAYAAQTLSVNNVVVGMYQTPGANPTCSLAPSSTGCGWLSVTPSTGRSPLTLTVTANPSSLKAGSYPGFFTLSTPMALSAVTVNVTLSISNPPSKLSLSSASFPVDLSGTVTQSLSFTFTTSDPAPAPASVELDVASTGDIIPFTLAVANSTAKGSGGSATTPVWLRLTQNGGAPAGSLTASGSAFPGSFAAFTVFLDPTALSTLDPAGSPYNGTVTVAAVNAVNGVFVIPVSLNVSAGAPSFTSVFPQAVNALMPNAPAGSSYVFTVVGDNFFTTSAVSLQQGTKDNPIGPSFALPQPTYLSRQALQVLVGPAYFTMATLGDWFLKVGNPVAATNPSLLPAYFPFKAVDPTLPTISGVVNAASYQPTSVWSGTGTDPLFQSGITLPAISAREIISIFGQNLGPAAAYTVPYSVDPLDATHKYYPDDCSGFIGAVPCVLVTFTYVDANIGLTTKNAPILMASMNQVNAIVPRELAGSVGQQVSVTVTNNGTITADAYVLQVVKENPGMFTYGGLGQGQGAIINYDATGTITSVNSSKNSESRGNTIAIYATGLGELAFSNIGTGDIVTQATNSVQDTSVRVDIGGQPCVVNYAGTSQMTVAGLVQINAVVPPNAKTGQAVPIVVSIGQMNGAASTARSTQSGTTVSVK